MVWNGIVGFADTLVKSFALATIVMVVVLRFLLPYYTIVGTSMEPNLNPDDRFFAIPYAVLNYIPFLENGGDPQHGDIVTFKPPDGFENDFVKRIVAGPGDTVSIENGKVVVNGVVTNYVDAYTNSGSQRNITFPYTLAADDYFVLGDNRGNSSDSRSWGPVHKNEIIGKAWVVVWPLPKISLISSSELPR